MDVTSRIKDTLYWPLKLLGIDFSISQAVVFMWLACLFIIVVLWLIGRASHFIPTRSQSVVEIVIDFLKGEFEPLLGEQLIRWLPFLLALFFFIWINNLLGLIPECIPATSNINVTAAVAVLVFLICQAAGIKRRGWLGHLRSFVPADLPWPLKIVFLPIELVSQIARPFSLAVRLFANMYAGQAIILSLSFLVVFFGSWLVAPLPVLGSALIHLFEIFVSTIQAYVFTYLAALYLGEAIETEAA